MRWIIAIGIATLLVGAAHAQYNPAYPGGNPGMPLQPNGTEAACFTYDAAGNLIPAENCRVFKEIAWGGACNAKEWPFNFTVDASVAQWVEWSITYTDADFWVRKPGVYVVDSVIISIKSNGDIELKADGWADLVGFPSGDIIEVELALLDCSVLPDANTIWYSAAEMQNKLVLLAIEDSDILHIDGVNKCLWIRITVERCDSACEYSGGGQLYVQLESQKGWLDEDGDWGPGFPPLP